MQKKTTLFFLSLMLALTGCTNTRNIPVDSDSTNQDQQENPTVNTPKETTQGSIDTIPPDITEDDPNENNSATENPKEALTKILKELQELDELLNGTD